MATEKRKIKRGEAEELRRELVAHFRGERNSLRREWVQQMGAKKLLEGMTPQETEAESATIYDVCVECLETAHYDSAEAYARRMAERGVLRGMTSEQILGGMLTLRDVYGRSLFSKYRSNVARLTAALDVYEPVANNILAVVAMAFIQERENVVRQQQEAIRELSTPVLQVREGLLILPIIGLIDSLRAKQLTEQLLRAIRSHRAKAVVVDITGVPAVDSKVANHLLQTIDAARLMGARVIVTGLSPDVAQALVYIGVDLARLKAVGDLQGGIEEADNFLGYVSMPKSNGSKALKE
ncbi:MAG TPA: STAS domain-containing protein [Syntrophales bacterium]|nr:STAS domain-containing protein [Syntrophales bacterium]